MQPATDTSVEVIERVYAVFNGGDLPGFAELLHPRIEWFTMTPALGVKRLSGREAVYGFFEELFRPFEYFRIDTERLEAAGAWVVADVQHRGKPAGGMETSYPFGHMWTVRDGWPTRFRLYVDRDRAHVALAGRRRAGG